MWQGNDKASHFPRQEAEIGNWPKHSFGFTACTIETAHLFVAFLAKRRVPGSRRRMDAAFFGPDPRLHPATVTLTFVWGLFDAMCLPFYLWHAFYVPFAILVPPLHTTIR